MSQTNNNDKSALHTDIEKAQDRIRKLLNMANDQGATEGERDTAMGMAMKLMAKHNLEMANFADSKVAVEDRKTAESEHHPCPWRRIVGGAIAQMLFCKMFFESIPGKQKYKFTFVGLESNVIVAKEMTDWLIKSIAREATVKQKEHKGDHAFATSFQNAAARRIEQRCYELRQEEENASTPKSGSTALVLVDVYKNENEANLKYIAEEMGITLKTKTLKGKSTDAKGHALGREYGDKVNLNKQIA